MFVSTAVVAAVVVVVAVVAAVVAVDCQRDYRSLLLIAFDVGVDCF